MKKLITPSIQWLAMLMAFFYTTVCYPQYCLPKHRAYFGTSPISGVILGGINNVNNGPPLLSQGYSDFTGISTTLMAGGDYTLTVITEDSFQHNFTVWIDFNQDQVFDAEETMGTVAIPTFNGPLQKDITFTVPGNAMNGPTRMRIRASTEPFGPWQLSNDPCLPFAANGEAEDYTVIIENGKNNNLAARSLVSPASGTTEGEEEISVEIRNLGNTEASGFTIHYSVDGGTAISETANLNLMPGHTLTHTFDQPFDFSGLTCYNIKAWVQWSADEIAQDDETTTSICKMKPVSGSRKWYLHSNIGGGLEPLGEPPFNSTTNEVTMNTVFGENEWEQGYFETTDPALLFSDSTCLVFLDGSYNHTKPLESFLSAHLPLIETWVAAGGKFFVNCSKVDGEKFYTDYGFGGVKATYFEVANAQSSFDGHPVYDGPFQPTGTDWGGFYFANAVIDGDDLFPVAHENDDYWQFGDAALHLPVVAEKSWGRGMAMFGTMGASQFLDPVPQPMNLRANILHYLSDCQSIVNETQEAGKMGELLVFPNPSQGDLTVRIPEQVAAAGQLQLWNTVGQIVWEQKVDAPAGTFFTIHLPELPNGMYFLDLQSGHEKTTARVVLAKG